ncbi:Receptor-binding cancer antigen expressed on SiSo cells [Chionoecetes opilio]|uniref:Receptor-binding cancer antigen expressed on SiSo cells n=1 Tax=Chionoecetes opilio TaxID=41210 RepID=A0A8J4XVY8_CHIOP|nr:Receptor-binding cancer antigen expressed on SiSo cells [Chionoecetes opilio]
MRKSLRSDGHSDEVAESPMFTCLRGAGEASRPAHISSFSTPQNATINEGKKMLVVVAFRKVKSVLLLLVTLVRRCFCCLRKRRNSESHLPIAVSIGSEGGHGTDPTQHNEENMSMWDSWDVPSSVVSDGGRSQHLPPVSLLQQQINQYRLTHQRKMQESEPEPEPEPNYFEDLAPSIEKKPQVVILERPEEEQQVSNRLSISLSDPILQKMETDQQKDTWITAGRSGGRVVRAEHMAGGWPTDSSRLASPDLGDWDDSGGGWEDEAEEEADMDAVLREKRHLERERRRQEQQRRKAEKEAARSSKLSGSKIATKLS